MVSIEQTPGVLNISSINKKGHVDFTSISVPKKEYFSWEIATPDQRAFSDVLTWDGKPVKKQKQRFLNKYRITEYLTSLPKYQQDKIFQFNIPKKFYCDIETEILDQFPDPKKAKAEVLSIAFATETEKILVLATQSLGDDRIQNIEKRLNDYFKKFDKKIQFTFKLFPTEYDMMYTFFNQVIKNMPLITGWNFIHFDWQYLMTRAGKLNIDTSVASPTGKIDRNGLPMHKIIVDYMEVYEKWDKVITIKESSKLDYVADKALGIKKVKYQGSLQDLYNNDYETFIFYNAVDAFLVRLIDEKLNTFIPYFLLAQLTKVEQFKVFKSVPPVENIMLQQLWNDQKRVFIYGRQLYKKDKKLKGAFVFEPITGRHKYTATFDYKSLYPHLMMQWNMSPDVYLGKDTNKLLSDDIIKTSTGAIFKRNEDGTLRILLRTLFGQRKEEKTKYGEIEAEINELKRILKEK